MSDDYEDDEEEEWGEEAEWANDAEEVEDVKDESSAYLDFLNEEVSFLALFGSSPLTPKRLKSMVALAWTTMMTMNSTRRVYWKRHWMKLSRMVCSSRAF